MTKRHYFQSLVILLATAYFVQKVFALHWFETILLILLVIVCVFHTIDVREDIMERRDKRKLHKEMRNNQEEQP